jgi:diguanylate cyclase (GGDEF)-like protein/PAS domain S-box-containing protein
MKNIFASIKKVSLKERCIIPRAFRYFLKTLNYQPLWVKFIFSLSLVLSLVALTVGELMRSQLQEDYFAELLHTNEETFLLLSAATLEPVISEDIPALQSIVDEMVRLNLDIYSIRIKNEDGILLAYLVKQVEENNQNLLSFSKEISFESEVFGVLSIDWSTQRLNKQVENQVNIMRYWVIASLLILTFFIILLINFFAVRPISKIHQHLLSLNEGNLQSRVKINSSKEFTLLGSSVNRLGSILELQKIREQELESAQQALFEAKEMAEITLHSIGDGVISTDINGCVQYLNPVSERLTGWKNHDAIGLPIENIFNLVDELNKVPLANMVRLCLQENQILLSDKHALLIAKNGQESAIDSSGSPIHNRQGKLMGAVLVFHDITERRNMTRKLEYQATHDSLTNLINRNEFDRKLFQYRQRVMANDSEHTLLYIDLDQFKIVNDTCGHAAGDALLQQIVLIIKGELRKVDIFARLGGDEFGILLQSCPLEFAIEIAESIRKTVECFRFVWNDIGFSIATSIGIVSITSKSTDAETLLKQADKACYSAKKLGRNRYFVYTEKNNHLIDRQGEMNWLSKVNGALADDRFVLYQQTILPLNENEAQQGEHIEILVRLVEEDGTIVPPGAFIPAAERYGLMSKVDFWVIKETLSWFKAHPEKMKAIALCNINLSGKSLSDDGLQRYIEEQMDLHEIDAQKFCFEITETTAVSNLTLAVNFIQRIKLKGCLFALDDFGSGMSSFGYLKTLPIDYLKIDGMFVKDIIHDQTSRTMVSAINEVGHVMGKRTIAEFVENKEILEQLKIMGVDFAQGYCISKPRPLQ